MATAPLQLTQIDAEALIKEQISQVVLPKGVTFKRMQPFTDASGDPAMRIFLVVPTSIPLTKRRHSELSAAKSQIFERVLALDLGIWPYVSLLESK